MDPHRWLDLFAAELGVEAPTPAEAEALLDLAGVAARASARTAAPLTCWIAARAGVAPSAALAIAQRLAVAAAGDTASS
ncbi:MAG: hypothetical protein NVS3B21_26300 [Acidimicrobiales bacterium]